MRSVIYSISLLITAALFVYGILGSVDTAVSYKYEIDDPTIEITLQKLVREGQEEAYIQLKEKKSQLEQQDYFYTGLIVASILGFVLLLIYRKRLLRTKTE